MSDLVIREVTPAIITFSKPFARYYLIPVGGRSTAVRLGNGDVWILASTPLTPETKEALNKLGPVKYIVAGDLVHHLFLAEYKAEYPEAKVIGMKALEAKKKDAVKFDGLYGKDVPDTTYGFEPEITAVYFSGFANKDIAFFHRPSKTLIVADLIFNLPATEQYSRTNAWVYGSFLQPHGKAHKYLVWNLGADKDAMKRDAQAVAEFDFERIIMCHGDVIESGGNAAWREAYKWYLEAKL
ncbi:hypothetical protein BOTBODRAFT_25908 [Botryobasidium botryosum FD-172 SS1]|uniref:Metallo-beta-lactamase domain-containing protein n=1 Tax=Botryobasidium botryosum (strain FD-172 SS1) TaxID=930990 RepID=A0A067NCG4_BOTB1|nr:hypothetical protein BOTBODRAFT_25908 [Botryobasidium botryosum FD-172 SS1]